MLINNTMNKTNPLDVTKTKLVTVQSSPAIEEYFDLTWNDIVYDGGLGTWLPRSSFRWLTISVCLIGIIGKFDMFLTNMSCYFYMYLN